MDQEMTGAFNGLRGDISREANTTRASMTKIHERIDKEKGERKDEMAAHDKESAVRATQMKNDIAQANDTAGEAKGMAVSHTEWHAEQAKLHKDEKRRGRGTWLVIAIALVGWLVSLFKDCAGSF